MNNPTVQLAHTEVMEVRWCDMDSFNHVNNSVYFSYFESARIGWWRTITPTPLDWQLAGPVIINAHCTFLRPLFYPETIHIELSVGAPGRSSHECFYRIYSAQDKTILYAEGSTKVVWVDRVKNQSIPLPEFILRHLPKPAAPSLPP